MRAQVLNPANGWNDAENVLTAESEPTEVTEIKGNFSQDDDDASAALGYTLTVPISMANDYNGYIASYREYQRGDHYRKALTGWGPHSADYLASRLVTIGRQFRDPDVELPTDQVQEEPFAAKAAATRRSTTFAPRRSAPPARPRSGPTRRRCPTMAARPARPTTASPRTSRDSTRHSSPGSEVRTTPTTRGCRSCAAPPAAGSSGRTSPASCR